jgi:hypothetical protein
MFELIFGLFWTAITVTIALAFFGGDPNRIIYVNDVPTPRSEFAKEPFFICFFAIFFIVGIAMIVIGVRKIMQNAATAAVGAETYGVVIDVYPSGSSVNGRPILNADVIIVEENGITGRYTESIGMDYNKYKPGQFVKVKHYKKDINILEKVEPHTVPYHIKDKIDAESGLVDNYNSDYNIGGTGAADTITINGVEYVRKN